MNEAIPVSYRKRKDLKPGTVFTYRWPLKDSPGQYATDDNYTFVVDKKCPGCPIEIRSTSDNVSGADNMELDCHVVWEPPTEKVEGHVRVDQKAANPKQAYGDLKVPVHTVPPALMLGAAKAFGEGAKKYGAFNWRDKQVEAMTYVGAIQRHLAAYIDGEDIDPESVSGKTHLEGVAACVGILLDCTYGGFLIDNRPLKGPAPKLVLTPKKES